MMNLANIDIKIDSNVTVLSITGKIVVQSKKISNLTKNIRSITRNIKNIKLFYCNTLTDRLVGKVQFFLVK